MERSMKALLGLLVLAAGVGGSSAMSQAKAQTQFRYCMIGTPNMGMDCTFSTLQQCQATASGGIGFCQENPAYVAQARQMPRPATRR
jgi:hypothetical protein